MKWHALAPAMLLITSTWAIAGDGSTTTPADAKPATVAIRIDLRKEKAAVPPTLYGIFMEEISHAFDGGIYAELIQNRSFEEGVLPPGMKLVKSLTAG